MQVNFIGHGLHTDKQINVGDQIATSFNSGIFDTFYGFVAFAASSGILKLLPSIQKAKTHYKRLVFFIGVDNKGTSKQALELLVDKEIEAYIYHKNEDYITYHPKLFLFEGAKHTRVIIGSANLTHSGFLNNIEASIQLDFQPNTDKQGNKLLTEVKKYFNDIINLQSDFLFKLDRDLIKKYDEQGLLYSQFGEGSGKEKETQPTDGENHTDEVQSVYPPDIEFGNGELPKERIRYDTNPLLNEKDLENFDYFLEEYRQYKKEINPTGVLSPKSENRPLYNWYKRIKELIKIEQLPDDFAKQLDDAGFPLGNGMYANSAWKWERNYQKLLQYMKDNKISYAYVPQRKNRNHPDYALGYWFARQKLRKKNLIPPPFLPGELEKLEAVNFKWQDFKGIGLADDDGWIENYFQLEEFWNKPENKNKIPAQSTTVGKWLNDQMTLYNNTTKKNAKGEILKMLPERARYIEDLCGKEIWQWQANKYKRKLEEQIAEYLEFRKVYPDEIPKNGDTRFKKVLDWKSLTRYRYKGDTSPENKWRMDILNSDRVKFPW
jgi:HKD family nuclease